MENNATKDSERATPSEAAELSAKEADAERNRARANVRDVNRLWWDVAKVLWTLTRSPEHFQRWGYKSWLDWAEHELDLQARKAEQLRHTYEVFFVLRHPGPDLQVRLQSLPWTKAREISAYVTDDNIGKAVKIAEELPRTALRERLRLLSPPDATGGEADGRTPVEVFRPIHFQLADTQDDDSTQFKIVQAALERAKELSESVKPGHNLVLICTDFLATNDFKKAGDPESLARFLAKLDDLLPVRLIAVDPKKKNVVHGLENVPLLVDSIETREERESARTTASEQKSASVSLL
jgi:hypothetical protein